MLSLIHILLCIKDNWKITWKRVTRYIIHKQNLINVYTYTQWNISILLSLEKEDSSYTCSNVNEDWGRDVETQDILSEISQSQKENYCMIPVL